jgi:Zn-dependent protease
LISLKLFGKSVNFRFGFFAVIAFFCLLDSPELGWISAAACTVHELGHLFCSVALGVKINSITFWAGGVKMTTDSKLRPAIWDTAILLSGPGFNFLAAAVLALTGAVYGSWINLLMGAFNLLPFSQLDGGSLLRLALESRLLNPGRAIKFLNLMILAAMVFALAALGKGNVTAYLTALILAVSEIME